MPRSASFYPFLVVGLSCFFGIPLNFVCPVCGTEWTLGNVFGVSRFKCLLLATCLVGAYSWLPETDRFDLSA